MGENGRAGPARRREVTNPFATAFHPRERDWRCALSQSSPPVPPPPPTPFEQRPDPLSYVPPSIHVATRAERVGFLPRLGAALLDAIILVPVLFIAIPGVVYLEEQGR